MSLLACIKGLIKGLSTPALYALFIGIEKDAEIYKVAVERNS